MRIILPSATIAVISGLASAKDSGSNHRVVTNKDGAFTKNAFKLTRDVNKAYESPTSTRGAQAEECSTFKQSTRDATKKTPREGLDLGVLGCNETETCVEDGTSSTGGRCAKSSSKPEYYQPPATKAAFERAVVKPTLPIFKARRNRPSLTAKNRALEDTTTQEDRQVGSKVDEDEDKVFECPTNCPIEFCMCAQADGDAEVCAPELHKVCTQNKISACVPDKYLTFYTETYCPFAECLAVSQKPYEECSCKYYGDYCRTYYSYVESIEKCAISTCCEGEPAGDKWMCLPGLEPTESPTMSPTFSAAPSVSPTTTSAPTVSAKPTVSQSPSASPTSSTAPTVSTAPTAAPIETPSASPTLSSSPTTTPTKAPTDRPTSVPSTSPTDFPSAMPSYPPSESPSMPPTVSSAPTVSLKPSLSPTTTNAPSTSSSPTDRPSTSTQPTNPPSLLPTVTQPPTASPSTLEPTTSPTSSPSKSPSADPTSSPSLAPITAQPTTAPVTSKPTFTPEPTPKPTPAPVEAPAEQAPPAPPSSATVLSTRSMVVSVLLGAGGALWLFA